MTEQAAVRTQDDLTCGLAVVGLEFLPSGTVWQTDLYLAGPWSAVEVSSRSNGSNARGFVWALLTRSSLSWTSGCFGLSLPGKWKRALR